MWTGCFLCDNLYQKTPLFGNFITGPYPFDDPSWCCFLTESENHHPFHQRLVLVKQSFIQYFQIVSFYSYETMDVWPDEYCNGLFWPPSSKKQYLILFECNRVVEGIPQRSPHVATCPNYPPLAASTGSWGAPRWPLLKAWERTWELRFSVMVESWIRILWWQHFGLMKT